MEHNFLTEETKNYLNTYFKDKINTIQIEFLIYIIQKQEILNIQNIVMKNFLKMIFLQKIIRMEFYLLVILHQVEICKLHL